MTDETMQDGQKTVVAFIAGLLVGGLLVWVFSETPAAAPTGDTTVQLEETETSAETDANADSNSDDTTAPDTSTDAEAEMTTDAPELPTGEGSAEVGTNTAGNVVALESATFPTDEGWVAVRSYRDGQLGNILGAARYSREQGLIPEEVNLLAPTIAGQEYAIVFFTENGDRQFNLSTDSQIDTEITTFTAQ